MMKDIPQIIPRQHLTHTWTYRDSDSKIIAYVARYDYQQKKWFRQYWMSKDGEWIEGAPTPLPLYGMESLRSISPNQSVYIFEGEKCTAAAHSLGLPAISSMMGAMQSEKADWAILANFRHIEHFVIVPDNDDPGTQYARSVGESIQKSCPNSSVSVYKLPVTEKGDDFVDWIKTTQFCPNGWNGFTPIDDPNTDYLRSEFERQAKKERVPIERSLSTISEMFPEDPKPFDESLPPVQPCPIHIFPPPIAFWLQTLADQMQAPIDYAFATFLVSCGSLIGRKRALHLRPGSGWIEFSNLWGMIVGQPSTMKSPLMKAVQRPFNRFNRSSYAAYQRALQEYEQALKRFEMEKNPDKETPKKPLQKRYVVQDATIEKLVDLLKDNPQGLLLFRDELCGWLNGLRKAGKENDRQLYLESWSGKEDFHVDRILRGSTYIPALCLSVFGGIQPGPLAPYVHQATKEGMQDDGFLQRFQVIVWPDHIETWQLIKTEPIAPLESSVTNILKNLDALDFNNEGKPIVLQFESEAQALFDGWQHKLENAVRTGKLPSHLSAHFGKYKKLLPSLALICEFLQAGYEQREVIEISKESVLKAIEGVEYLKSHTYRLYSCGQKVLLKAAKLLLGKIKQGDLPVPFTARDVYHAKHWTGLSNAEEVKEAVSYLVEKGYLHQTSRQTNGKPTVHYFVHPKCLP